jgi:hypothetical protein
LPPIMLYLIAIPLHHIYIPITIGSPIKTPHFVARNDMYFAPRSSLKEEYSKISKCYIDIHFIVCYHNYRKKITVKNLSVYIRR